MDEQPMVADGIYGLDAVRQCRPFYGRLLRRHHQTLYVIFPRLHAPHKKFKRHPVAPTRFPTTRLREGTVMAEPSLAPGDPAARKATAAQCLRLWLDLMGTCQQFLLAGLRREIGPDGDLATAYRRWYAGQMEEHERMMVHLMQEFARRDGSHAP